MTTILASIPDVSVYHLPTPTAEPILLTTGDLSLILLPASPPTTVAETLTLTVSHVTFPITASTPVGKTDSINQHASYVFLPGLPETATGAGVPLPTTTTAGNGFGKVKIVQKDSVGPEAHEKAEALAAQFEGVLKLKGVWKEAGYYDIEDAEKAAGVAPSYGTVLGTTLSSYGHYIASQLSSLTDSHISSTPSSQAAPPPESLKNLTKTLAETSTVAAGYVNIAAEVIAKTVHDGAAFVGAGVKEGVNKVRGEEAVNAPPGENVERVKKAVSDAWEEVKLGAKGAYEGGATVGTSLSENTHKAIAHDLGPGANDVAKDIGQTNTNIASAAYDGTRTYMGSAHAFNAAVGGGEGVIKGPPS